MGFDGTGMKQINVLTWCQIIWQLWMKQSNVQIYDNELFMTLLSWCRLGDNFWKYMIDLTNWIRQDEKAGGSEWLNPTTQNRRTLNERTAHLSFCFPSFGLSLMREEVTMVIEDTAYLELCNAFFFFVKHTHSKEEKRLISSSGLWGNKRTYRYLHTHIYIHANRWNPGDESDVLSWLKMTNNLIT